MAEKKPNIRFKGFEEEWKDKQLKDVVQYHSTGIRACDASQNGRYPLYDANGEIGKIDSVAKQEPYISIIKDGSGVGRVRMMPSMTNVLGTMGCIAATEDSDINFIFSHLQTKDFGKHIISGAIPHVYFRDYGEDKLSTPFLPEQRKIGEFFKQLDELIGAKEQELEKLRQIKLALLDKMFPSDNQENINGGGKSLIYKMLQNNSQLVVSSPAPNTPTIRFRGFTEPWVKYPISHRVTYGKGRGYSKASLQQSGTPILLYGTLYTDYNTYITEVNRYSAKKDWAVMSKGNEVVVPASGETAEDIARASAILKAGIILGGDLNIIYPDDNLDASFLALELTYGNSHRKLVKKAQGISVVHLHNTDISELEINVPSYNEQRKIGDFFRSQDEAIANSQLQINKLKTIKQACLSQMFA